MASGTARLARRFVAGLALVAVSTGGSLFPLGGSAPTARAACTVSSNLRLGSTGDGVRCLQQTLNGLGYNSGPVDGSFGSVTYRAVLAFQRAKGLYVDGLVGPRTGTALGIWGTSTSAPTTPTAPASPSATGDYVVRSGDTLYGIARKTGTPINTLLSLNGLRLTSMIHPGQTLKVAGSSSTPGTSTGGSGATTCAPPSGVPADARQLVVVTSNGTSADVDLLVNNGGGWTCTRTNMSGRVGRNGVRPLEQRTSGDGTTPGGVFPLGTMTAPDGQTFQFFGNGSNPGVQGSWRQVKAGDCWGATPGTSAYNALVSRAAANCTGDDEYLPNFQNSYSRAALIGANMGPNRSGDQPGEHPYAAAIFLHRHSYDTAGSSRPTSGCVSLDANDLAAVLQQLVPGQAYFVIR